MFFIHLSSALLPKQVSYRLLSSLARSQLRYNTQLFHSRLLDTVGYHYLLSFKRKWNDCFIKNRFLFHLKTPIFFTVTFRGNIIGFYSALELKKAREMWPKRSFTEAVAYVNLKCAVANLFLVQRTANSSKVETFFMKLFGGHQLVLLNESWTILVPGLNETSP